MLSAALLLVPALLAAPAGEPAPEPCTPSCITGDPPMGPFGSVRVGFSAWRGSIEVQARAGWAFRRLSTGIVVEHNPFIDLSRPDISTGAFGFGAFLAYRHRLTDRVSLRFGLLAGGSVLLFDTVGYSKGDVGLWIGAHVMGLDVGLSEHATLLVDVVDLSLPAFHLAGMPFIHPEWRWSIGIAFH